MIKNKKITETLGFALLTFCMILVLFILGVILYDIISKGSSVISWAFLTEMPKDGMTKGGIFPAIVGDILGDSYYSGTLSSNGNGVCYIPKRIC